MEKKYELPAQVRNTLIEFFNNQPYKVGAQVIPVLALLREIKGVTDEISEEIKKEEE